MGVESVADMLYCRSLRNDQTKQLLVEYHTASCHPACYLKVIINPTAWLLWQSFSLTFPTLTSLPGVSAIYTHHRKHRALQSGDKLQEIRSYVTKISKVQFDHKQNPLHLYKDFINKLSEPKLNIQTLISVQ